MEGLPRKTADMAFLKPVTCNCYENAVRYNNLNCSPVCNGFTADTTSVMQPVVMDDNTVVYGSEVRDVFMKKRGVLLISI